MFLQVDNVVAGYDKSGQTRVLDNVSFQAKAGEVTIIVGPNGCGKSTLLRCISRLHKPQSGSIQLAGKEVWQMKPRSAAHHLSLLPQSPIAPEAMTVSQLIAFGRHPHQGLFQQWSDEDQIAVNEALTVTGLTELSHRRLDQLSGGQRQRCWLGMTLAQQTPMMLLDEPTSALDIGHQVEVLSLVRQVAKEKQRTVIIVLHDLVAAAQYADQLITMREGKIVASGHPREILSVDLIRDLYDVETEILYSSENQTPVIVAKQPMAMRV